VILWYLNKVELEKGVYHEQKSNSIGVHGKMN